MVNGLFFFGIDPLKLGPASSDPFDEVLVLVVGRDALVLVNGQDHDMAKVVGVVQGNSLVRHDKPGRIDRLENDLLLALVPN